VQRIFLACRRAVFPSPQGESNEFRLRKDNPQTSVEAAQAVDSTKLEQIVYEAIKGFPEGCISDEILEMYPHYPYSSITARYRALLDKGFIEVTGVRRGKFGRNQRVMKAVK